VKKPIPFGKYYLLERINVGGMAEVFRAKAYGVEGFERLVAVKRILPNIAEDKEFIRMFIDEAKIAVQLNHANIAQIFDLGVVDNHYYIALEHVHGRDLRAIFDRCRQRGGGAAGEAGEPMPIAQACFIIMKVCEGLDYAHNKRDQTGRELNLVHRDVSPQNVLVSFEGEVKLIDFGIAKAAGKGSKTQAGILKGKFGYMSPEQVRGLPIDRRSDIFSCGIVLYELLTGERLFVGESDFSTLEKVRNVEILPPSTYNRKIPDELERIVLKALAKDEEDRYQNAIDLHDELQAFVYTAGEFYSRKDLASWMKITFAREIEEETAKLESYRQIGAPPGHGAGFGGPRKGPPSAPPPRRSTLSMPGGTRPPPVPPKNGRRTAQAHAVAPPPGQGLEWDEDELETAIYPEKDESSRAGARPAAPTPGLAAQLAGAAARGDDLEGPLASTARNWPPPPSLAARGAGGLADGSGTAPALPGEETVDDASPVMGTADPSAVVELATLAQARKAEPIYGDLGSSSTFGSGYLSAHGRRSMGIAPATLAKIAAVALAAVGLAVLVFFLVRKDGGDAPAGDGAGAQAAAGTGDPAAAQPGAAAQPMVTADPNTGFDLIVDPAGVKVKLDGREIGKAPLQIRNLTDGEHVVEIEGPPGFWGKSQTVRVTRGQAERVIISLDAMEVVAKLTSDPPGARVTLLVNGEKEAIGSTPVEHKLDPRKRYEAVFRKDGYQPVTRALTMTGAQEIPVSVTLERASSRSREDRATALVAEVARADRRPAEDATPGAVTRPAGQGSSKPSPAPAEDGGGQAGGGGEPAAEQFGTLGLMSKPPCKIFIDGRDTGEKTPKAGIKLKAGRHRVTLVNNEFGIKESFVVKVKPNETTKVLKDLTDRLPK